MLYVSSASNMSGTVWQNCADVPLRNYSLTHSPFIQLYQYNDLHIKQSDAPLLCSVLSLHVSIYKAQLYNR